ncbi:hypothetical protein [Azospirillum sp. sgz302134]
MRLVVEVMDQKTLSWNVLACHEGVGIDAAPGIVAVLRDGLPEATSVRWNWSRKPQMAAQTTGTPSVPARPRPGKGRFNRR